MWIGRGAQKKHGGAASRPRTERGAENAASGDRGTYQFCFEELGDEIGDRHRPPAKQVKDTVFPESPDVASRLKKIPEILRRWGIDRWWSDRGNLREYQRHFFERSGEFRVIRGVFRGEARNPTGGFGVIVVKEQRPA